MMFRAFFGLRQLVLAGILLVFLVGCWDSKASSEAAKPRLCLFVGMDISGSFLNSRYFNDSIDFLAHYIYGHLNGLGGLEKPFALFVGSIGGSKRDEPKTLFPIQTFENKSIAEIKYKLKEIFPAGRSNPFTDYNAFFEQIAHTVTSKKLLLKPISIVMISDGKPDLPASSKKENNLFRDIHLRPLERLSRNITLRLLYTDAVVGQGWQTLVPRRRVKVWTQDAAVMTEWRDPNILQKGKSFPEQERFFAWVRDNVNFGVRSQRVD